MKTSLLLNMHLQPTFQMSFYSFNLVYPYFNVVSTHPINIRTSPERKYKIVLLIMNLKVPGYKAICGWPSEVVSVGWDHLSHSDILPSRKYSSLFWGVFQIYTNFLVNMIHCGVVKRYEIKYDLQHYKIYLPSNYYVAAKYM